MITRKAVFRDMDLCVNCKACIVACNVKHMSNARPEASHIIPTSRNLLNVYPTGPEIRDDRVYQAFIGIACMHCAEAPCIKVCPTSAIYKDTASGVTLVDDEKCIGCRACIWVCPYGAPTFDGRGKMLKCDLCIDRLREGKKTACEHTCAARAIFVGTPEEIAEIQARKAVERIRSGAIIS
ncbi:MAG: 4Fe-4S binding protein [Chloroflexi bacterium]|nr:4Fe-4S binding protein [Chloroflexota bacterium]